MSYKGYVMKPQFIFAFVALALVSVSCTKKVDYDYTAKSNVEPKSLIDTKAQYLYVASVGNSSRTSGSARPYWVGETKLVKFKFTEDALQIVEADQDGRFQDNSTNNKLVMSIPVTHLQYRCATDKYGECTQKEEEDNYLDWKARSQFKPSFDKVSVAEINTLPMELEKALGSPCYTEKSAQFVGYKLEDKALNFQIEKTFSVNPRCASQVEDLADLTVTTIFHYSFVLVDSVATPAYQAVDYPQEDESTFGFFTTDVKKLDVDFSDTTQSKKTFMNRWNPKRETVTYYLSKEFEKPENAALKKATFKAVEKINKGLAESGAQFRVDLQSANGRVPGDVRHNFIIMVEDPVASNILGYGPAVADPRTGEIISARTVMYPGVMKQFVRWTYDQILTGQEQKKLLASEKLSLGPVLKAKLEALKKSQTKLEDQADVQVQSVSVPKAPVLAVAKSTSLLKAKVKSDFTDHGKMDWAKMQDLISGKKLEKQVLTTLSLEDQMAIKSKGCEYPAELFNFDQAVSNALKEKIQGGNLKPWEKLSAGEKQAVIDIILPEVWIPTLVHEMGHNLGLRHNFKGSEDKANYFTRKELDAMGVAQDIPYSSVMDYPYTDLNMLPAMGKYDVAALRFAYQRQVQDESGKLIPVANTLEGLQKENPKLKLKAFGYCSDEHVEVNAGCKRFDEGSTYTEMAAHAIKSFNESYERRNFRRDRRNFSVSGDLGAAGRAEEAFSYIRFHFEFMSRLKDRFGLDYDAEEYQTDPFLKDIKQAADLAGNFLLDVLQTPEQTCVIADIEKKEIMPPTLLTDISADAMNCASVVLKKQFKVVGEFGKSFNSKKDPASNNPYADQIDVRGIWMNKLVAAEILLSRSLDNSSWDKTDDSFIDYGPLRTNLVEALSSLFSGSVNKSVSLQLSNGQVVELPVTINLANTQLIENPLMDNVKKRFGMPNRDVYLQELLLPIIQSSVSNRRQLTDFDRSVLDAFRVARVDSFAAINEKEPNLAFWQQDGSTVYVATESNVVARQVISALQTNATLAPFEGKDIVAAALKLQKGELAQLEPSLMTGVEQAVVKLGLTNVAAYLNGDIQDSSFLSSMLQTLSK